MNKKLLVACALFSATLVNAQSVRLKATANFIFKNAEFRKADSSTYNYSFGRSFANFVGIAQTNWSLWAADNVNGLIFDLTTGQDTGKAKTLQFYNNIESITNAYALRFLNNSWDTTAAYSFHYANGGIDTFRIDYKYTNWMPGQRTIYILGQYGVEEQYFQGWNPNTNLWVDNQHTINTYTNGNLAESIVHQWNGSAWLPIIRYTHTYTNDNITATVIENYNNGWMFMDKTLYTYDVNDDAVEVEDQSWSNGAWQPVNRWLKTYNMYHRLLTDITQSWINNQWVNVDKKEHTYETHGLIESIVSTKWDSGSGQFVPEEDDSWKSLYYYEEFDPASARTTTKENTVLNIFPNPANRIININLQSVQTQAFGVTIFDATGRAVRHWNEAPTTLYQQQVNVEDLPPGNYFLGIDNRPQEAVPFTILK